VDHLVLSILLRETIDKYFTDGYIDFRVSILAVKLIEISLFTAFCETVARSAAKAAEPAALPVHNTGGPKLPLNCFACSKRFKVSNCDCCFGSDVCQAWQLRAGA